MADATTDSAAVRADFFPEPRCYCDDPIDGHEVAVDADCYCDGVCRDDCACHAAIAAAGEEGR